MNKIHYKTVSGHKILKHIIHIAQSKHSNKWKDCPQPTLCLHTVLTVKPLSTTFHSCTHSVLTVKALFTIPFTYTHYSLSNHCLSYLSSIHTTHCQTIVHHTLHLHTLLTVKQLFTTPFTYTHYSLSNHCSPHLSPTHTTHCQTIVYDTFHPYTLLTVKQLFTTPFTYTHYSQKTLSTVPSHTHNTLSNYCLAYPPPTHGTHC